HLPTRNRNLSLCKRPVAQRRRTTRRPEGPRRNPAVIDTSLEPIPGYRLNGRLGAGAFGEVWTAVGPDGRPVALKFFDTGQRVSSVIQAEVRMLRALGALRHPHIIEFHGVHVRSHYVILQMERADGNLADLRQAYREEVGTNIPIDHGLELLQQAAEALDF